LIEQALRERNGISSFQPTPCGLFENLGILAVFRIVVLFGPLGRCLGWHLIAPLGRNPGGATSKLALRIWYDLRDVGISLSIRHCRILNPGVTLSFFRDRGGDLVGREEP